MPISYDKLECALRTALRDWTAELLLPTGGLELVGLYTSGELNHLAPTFAVRQDLKPEQDRLVFSPPDWKNHLAGEALFQRVQAELDQGWDANFSHFEVNADVFLEICARCLLEWRQNHLQDINVPVYVFVAGEAPWRLTGDGKLQKE